MAQHFGYAVCLVFATTLIHVACTLGVIRWIRSLEARRHVTRSAVVHATFIGALILGMSLAAFCESALWAALYVGVGALPNMDDALYFSLVTFTTLGYGDISLGKDWRLLSAFEAANGIILFGWTTAIIIAFLQRLLRLTSPSNIEK